MCTACLFGSGISAFLFKKRTGILGLPLERNTLGLISRFSCFGSIRRHTNSTSIWFCQRFVVGHSHSQERTPWPKARRLAEKGIVFPNKCATSEIFVFQMNNGIVPPEPSCTEALKGSTDLCILKSLQNLTQKQKASFLQGNISMSELLRLEKDAYRDNSWHNWDLFLLTRNKNALTLLAPHHTLYTAFFLSEGWQGA